MKSLRLLALIVISGLFYFSEGKPCPEKTRPHKSRCDAYFKCIVLPSKSHVWMPEKCEQGLIYEPNLRMCVLPGDDWECNLGDLNKNSDTGDDNVVYGVGVDGLSGLSDPTKDLNGIGDSTKSSESDESTENETKGADYINIEGGSSIEHDFEASGDGGSDYIMLDTTSPESKTSNDLGEILDSPNPSKIDPKLTAHLQRLSQLIDGLKQTYQSKDSAASDLRPDQLNAFLAHYNIKAQLDLLNPAEESESIPKKEDVKQNQTMEVQSTTAASSQLDPETKVVLTNQLPNGFNPRPTDGYSNSQIVVNKPEGSVLFTLGNQPQDTPIDHRYDPKISEDTLKTVLELSKQMIENQNVRRIIPNSGYYPQVVQPIYLPPPIPQYAGNIFNHQDGYGDKKYDKASSTYYVPQEKPEKPATTIIHNNVIPVHVSSTADDKSESVDSYGQKLNSYPPLSGYQYNGDTSAEAQNHHLTNRYENNQLVTIRPNVGHNNFNNYQYQQDYMPTTTSRPYISDTGSTLTDYYTPSPHLDETNVNTVFQVERYPTINYGNIPSPPKYAQPTYNRNRPDPSLFIPPKQQNTQYYQNPYQSYYYPNQQSILQLFPSHIDPSKVKIRPNSQKLESMEQDTSEDSDSGAEDDQSASGSSDDNQLQSYNRYSANKQIVANQLAQYVEQLNNNRPQKYNTASSGNPSRSRLPATTQPLQQSEDESQLVNFGGNLFPYDLFNTKLLAGASLDESKVDTSNCPVGVRQPNTTDCTKYYVCSRQDGSVMQYSCPAYTAFNTQSRICDAHFYAVCNPNAVISRFTVSENHRIQMEAIKALQNAQRIRNQALQAQKFALRLRLGDTDNDGNKQYSPSTPLPQSFSPHRYSSEELSNFVQNAIDSSHGSNSNVPSQIASVTQRPHQSYGTPMVTKKRKYYCKEGDKVADQTSIYSYFVCYKNSQGMMKGHKMTCSQGLLFCPMTTMCTLPIKCS